MNVKNAQNKALIERLTKYAISFDCYEVSRRVLEDPKLSQWSGSSKGHHYGYGGLLRHITEVVDLCLMANKRFDEVHKAVDETQLFLAALYHDIGKTFDYKTGYSKGSCLDEIRVEEPEPSVDVEWFATDHKHLIHHLNRSVIIWNEQAALHNIDSGIADNITHAILAHHGHKKWGSPVKPQTPLAWILHSCDQMSARVDDPH